MAKRATDSKTGTALDFAQKVKTLSGKITALKVDTAEQSVQASELLREAAILRRDIEKVYKDKRQPLLDQQKKIIAEEKALTNVLALAESACQRLIRAFQQAEAKARADKEAAERKAREDAARAEAALRADQLRAAAAAAPSKSVAKRLEKQADVIEQAQPIIDPVPVEDAPQTLAAGVSGRKYVHAAVDGLPALVLQIAAQEMLKRYAGQSDPVVAGFLSMFKPSPQATMDLLLPSMPKLNDLAKAYPKDLELQGVRVVEDEGFVARR